MSLESKFVVKGIEYDLRLAYIEDLLYLAPKFDLITFKNEFLTYFLDLSKENSHVIERHFKYGKGSLDKIYSIMNYLDIESHNIPEDIIHSYIKTRKVNIGKDLTPEELKTLSPEEILIRRGL